MRLRGTRRLGLNAFPTRIWYNDAVTTLKKLSVCLDYLDREDERVIKFREWPVTYEGEPMLFSEIVDSLQTLPETG